MSNGLSTAKLNSDLVHIAREEGQLWNRSIGSQLEHGASIGRAFEATPGFTLDRVRAALHGRYDAALLEADEAEMFDDLLGAVMDGAHTQPARDFWADFAGQPNTDL